MVPAGRERESGDILTFLSLILILLQRTPFPKNVQLVIHTNMSLSLKLFV